MASDVGEDPVHFKNTLLPSTRAEVGIPIASGDLVFGALDVQSTESNAFDSEAIIVLQTLANQIAAGEVVARGRLQQGYGAAAEACTRLPRRDEEVIPGLRDEIDRRVIFGG